MTDTARSKQEVKLFFVLSEGEIEEVSELYINEVNISGSKIDFAWVPGTFNQKAIPGFSSIADGVLSAGELTRVGGPKTLGPFPDDVEYVEVTVATTGIYYNSDTEGPRATRLAIWVATSNTETGENFILRNTDTKHGVVWNNLSVPATGYYNLPGTSPAPGDIITVAMPAIYKKEKVTTAYSFSIRIEKPAGTTEHWRVRLTRQTADSGANGPAKPLAISNITYQTFRNTDRTNYSGTAVGGIRIEDVSETDNAVPNIGFKGKGMKMKVPSTTYYNAYTRTYTGSTWDGTFSPTRTWTNNLSWVLYNLLSDTLTKDIAINASRTVTIPIIVGIGIPENRMAKYTFDKFAKKCDQMIHGERRYSVNGQYIEQQDGTNAMNDILSLGEAQLAEINGLVSVVYDKELSPAEINVLPIFTNENIIEGVFSYSNSHISENYTQINVTIQDKDNFNKLKSVISESEELMQWLRDVGLLGISLPYKIPAGASNSYFIDRFGYNTSDMLMRFTNSEAAGARKARSLLWDSLMNNEFVSFRTVIQGAQFYRGKVIRIADSVNGNITSTGRIVSSSYDSGAGITTIVLDRAVTLPNGVSSIYFYTGTETATEIDLNNTTTPYSEVYPRKFTLIESGSVRQTVSISAFIVPIDDSIFVIDNELIQLYTVVSNIKTDDGYETSCMKYDINKFSFIDKDYTIPVTKRFRQPTLRNTSVSIVDTDYLTNNTPTKGIHIENRDNNRVNGLITLKWDHTDIEVSGAGQTVYYVVEYMTALNAGIWRKEIVSSKVVEIQFTAPMPTEAQLLNAEVIEGASLPDDTFIINFKITTKSRFAEPSKPVYVDILYTINRNGSYMVNSSSIDDL